MVSDRDNERENDEANELLEVAKAMRDYIDALPTDVVAALPVMPGFDRDWADEVIYEAESASK